MWKAMHFVCIFSYLQQIWTFKFPKVVQQHREGVVGDIKHLCSKFHKLSGVLQANMNWLDFEFKRSQVSFNTIPNMSIKVEVYTLTAPVEDSVVFDCY